jgi:hypothetical protein
VSKGSEDKTKSHWYIAWQSLQMDQKPPSDYFIEDFRGRNSLLQDLNERTLL